MDILLKKNKLIYKNNSTARKKFVRNLTKMEEEKKTNPKN